MKRCIKCQENKSLYLYGKDKRTPDGHRSTCSICYNKWLRNHRKNSEVQARIKVSRKNTNLKKMYGINREEYLSMLDKQGGKCAICESSVYDSLKRDMAVDHNHSTGKVRGLLCSACNIGLGKFKDSIEILNKATKYLVDHKGE